MEKKLSELTQSLDPPELMSRTEVAMYLHVSLSFVDHLIDLPFYKIGSKKLYAKNEVLAYLAKNHLDTNSRKVSKTDSIYSRGGADE